MCRGTSISSLVLLLVAINFFVGECTNLRASIRHGLPEPTIDPITSSYVLASFATEVASWSEDIPTRSLYSIDTDSKNCTNVKEGGFKASLDLQYEYLVETTDPNVDVEAIERSIFSNLQEALSICDETDHTPIYHVTSSYPDTIASNGKCSPPEVATSCYFVNASVTIFLDKGYTVAKRLTYDTIRDLLANSTSTSFNTGIVRSEFVREISDRITLFDTDSEANEDSRSSGLSPVTRSWLVVLGVGLGASISICFTPQMRKFLNSSNDDNTKKTENRNNCPSVVQVEERSDKSRKRSSSSVEAAEANWGALKCTSHDKNNDKGSLIPLEKIEEEASIEGSTSTDPEDSSGSDGCHPSNRQHPNSCYTNNEKDIWDDSGFNFVMSPDKETFPMDVENPNTNDGFSLFSSEETDDSGFPIFDSSSLQTYAVAEKIITMDHQEESLPNKEVTQEEKTSTSDPSLQSKHGTNRIQSRRIFSPCFDLSSTSLQTWLVKLLFQLHVAPQIKKIEYKK